MSADPTSMETELAERHLRADARRNRERVLAAARVVLAEQGLEAGMSEIAEQAGVGVGTLYRHFPTKELLVEALVADHLDRLLAEAAAAEREEGDAWHALVRVLRFLVRQKAEDKCLCEVWEGRAGASDELVQRGRLAFEAIGGLVRRAQDSGTVRADIAPGDVPLVLAGLGATAWLHGARGGELSERYLAIVLDGLRAPGATPLPHRTLSRRELELLMHAPKEPLPPRRRRAGSRREAS